MNEQKEVKGWAVIYDGEVLHMSPRPDIFHEGAKTTAEEYAEVYRQESGREVSIVPCTISYTITKPKKKK